MSWLSSARHWIAALDPNAVGAWATAASALASFVLVGATVRLTALTSVLAREARLAREADERADVQCSVESRKTDIQLMDLVISNVGKSSAKDVSVKIERGGRLSVTPNPVFPFSIFLPGRSTHIFIGSYMEMPDKIFKATITYKDKFGDQSFAYQQDLSQWLSIVQIGSPPATVMADSLKKIAETVESWNRSNRVKVDTFDSKDRNEEYEKQREHLAKDRKETDLTP